MTERPTKWKRYCRQSMWTKKEKQFQNIKNAKEEEEKDDQILV